VGCARQLCGGYFLGIVAVAWSLSCTLPREGTLDVDELSGGGFGGGAPGGGGMGGALPSCALGDCVELPSGAQMVRTGDVCPADLQATSKLIAVDPGCEPCVCGDPGGGTCSLVDIVAYGGNMCGGTVNMVMSLSANECLLLNNNPDSYRTGMAVASEGSCSAGDTAPLPLQQLSTCEPDTALAECGEAGVCVPPELVDPCILLVDDGACPAAFPVATTLAGGAFDARKCDCDCGPSAGLSCAGLLMNVYATGDCSGGVAGTVGANMMQCAVIEGQGDQSIDLVPGQWAGNPCEPMDVLSGGVAFNGTQTLCCRR